ncbi:MAG: histidine--tRNA ligase [Bacteroidales bacterium]
MAQKPGIPKGTRDFSPLEMHKRNFIFDTIKEVYEIYGFQPLETPAMENLSTLTGKYGEEGDRLLFKILNSGDYLKNVQDIKAEHAITLTPKIAEKGLRYDLTVPFARYVVQHQHELSFPFKRYQIQPVWRADRPQKGRYREFYQCDADVIGTDALYSEAEFIKIIDEVFQRLNIKVTVKINNRKILYGVAEAIGAADYFKTMTVAMDKLDKIGTEKVAEEMLRGGMDKAMTDKLQSVLNFDGTMNEALMFLKDFVAVSETGLKGIEEIQQIIDKLQYFECTCGLELDITLARGLDYYTGAIIEVVSEEAQMGSICGGGRYDDLTGIFGLKNVSGIGISFGAERIYDILEELKRFPQSTGQSIQVLFVNFGDEEEKHCIRAIQQFRAAGIASELFPKAVKMKKQLNFANHHNIPWVVLMGAEEIQQQNITIKNMENGQQHQLKVQQAIALVKK